MRRPTSVLIALLASMSLSVPAWAGGPDTPVSVWGFTGTILTPTAHVLGFQEMQLSGGYAINALQGTGFGNYGLGGFHVGLLQGLEAGVTYNAPGSTALAGDFKFRLLKQSGAVPISLAVGGMQLGVPMTPLSMNNQLYLMLGHDLQWAFGGKPVSLARASIGFGTNLTGALPMANLQIPVLHYGSLEAEYIGKIDVQDPQINAGITINPFPWLGIRAASLGTITQAVGSRSWFIGANLTTKTPANGNLFDLANPAAAAPTPAPGKAAIPSPPPVVSPPPVAAASPAPVPSAAQPTPAPSPTPTVEGVVQGKVLSAGKGVERIPLTIVGGVTRKTWSEPDGSFKFPKAPIGTYRLKITREGWKPVDQEVVVGPGATEVTVALVALPATLKGQVTSSMKGVGGVTVAIDSLGIVTLTKADGTYTLADIPAGSYTITYSKAKKQLDKVQLNLSQGETVARNVTLNPVDVPQPAKAIIRGTITDAKNAALTGARVTLEGKDLTVMTISGPDGAFVLRELPAGAYKLSVSKQGFTARYFSLTLKAGQEAKHTIALQPGK
jgi:hypothetical protein